MKFTSILDVVFLLKVQVIKTSDTFECVKLLNTGKEGVLLGVMRLRAGCSEVTAKRSHEAVY